VCAAASEPSRDRVPLGNHLQADRRQGNQGPADVLVPKGKPMIVKRSRPRAEVTWPIASPPSRRQPETRSRCHQPRGRCPGHAAVEFASADRLVQPKWPERKLPITKQAAPRANPTTVIAAPDPSRHQPRPHTKPPSTNQNGVKQETKHGFEPGMAEADMDPVGSRPALVSELHFPVNLSIPSRSLVD